MSQSSNPQTTYRQNPNQIDLTGLNKGYRNESNPNLTSSRPQSQHARSIISFITYATLITGIVALVSLVSSNMLNGANAAAATLDNDNWRSVDYDGQDINVETLRNARRILAEDPLMRDFSLVYFDLKSYLDKSSISAQSYVMTQVAHATRISLDGKEDAEFSAMEHFVERTKKIPGLKEKIDTLLRLNATFGKTLADAVDAEVIVQKLRSRYDFKIKTLDDYSKKATRNIQEAGEISKKIIQYQTSLDEAEISINNKINALKNEKQLVQGRIDDMKNRIAYNLKKADVPDMLSLVDKIAHEVSAIDAQRKIMENCEKKIESHFEEITHLNIKHTDAHRLLGDIELQLSQWHWVQHVLETISKFEGIREQIVELQKAQLKEGKVNVLRLIGTLTDKEAQYADDKRKFRESGSGADQIDKQVIVDANGNTKIIETVKSSNAAATLLENQQNYIQKEQTYLKTWSREQFKTLNLSTHEVRNLTRTIDHLQARLSSAGEYDSFIDLKSMTEKQINELIIKIKELEKGIEDCENVIGEHKETIQDKEALKRELERIRDIIRDIENQMNLEEAQLQAKDAALRKERQDLNIKRSSLTDNIRTAQLKLQESRELLRGLVRTINDRIRDPPRLEEVKDNIEKYRAKVRKSNDEFQNLVKLMDEIKKIAC